MQGISLDLEPYTQVTCDSSRLAATTYRILVLDTLSVLPLSIVQRLVGKGIGQNTQADNLQRLRTKSMQSTTALARRLQVPKAGLLHGLSGVSRITNTDRMLSHNIPIK